EEPGDIPTGLPFSDPRMADWQIGRTFGFTSGGESKQNGWVANVYIHEDLNNFLAALTLVHEIKNVEQGPTEHPWSTDAAKLKLFLEERFEREYEAHLAEAQWLAENQDWITKEKLGSLYDYYTKEMLKCVDGKWEVNPEGIKAYVKRVYIDKYTREARGTYAQ